MKHENYYKIIDEIGKGFKGKKGAFEGLNVKKSKKNKKYKKHKKHIEKVRQISKMLCIMFDVEDDERNIVDIGALLHDLGKQIKKKEKKKYKGEAHNKVGFLIAKEGFKNLGDEMLSEEEKDLILKIIEYHRGSLDEAFFGQSQNNQKLILIVRLADVISKGYKLEKMFKELDDCCLRMV